MVICFLFKWCLQEPQYDNYHLTMHEKQNALQTDGIRHLVLTISLTRRQQNNLLTPS